MQLICCYLVLLFLLDRKMKSGGHAFFNATRQYTRTHTCRWRRWKVFSAFNPSWHPPPGTARSSGQRCGTQGPSPRSCLGQGQDWWAFAFFCMFLLLGFYRGNPGNMGRTCKLHTERPGNKPRHVARCGTWTHDLLAVRQQCYALCHRTPPCMVTLNGSPTTYSTSNELRYSLIEEMSSISVTATEHLHWFP